MSNVVNLTPHTINFVKEDGEICKLPPSGQVARVSSTQQDAGEFGIFKLSKTKFGEVVDLPSENGDLFIVSALVRTAVANRMDVASPGDLLRDAEGNVIGCKNFIVN
jgi:hypothetical protein